MTPTGYVSSNSNLFQSTFLRLIAPWFLCTSCRLRYVQIALLKCPAQFLLAFERPVALQQQNNQPGKKTDKQHQTTYIDYTFEKIWDYPPYAKLPCGTVLLQRQGSCKVVCLDSVARVIWTASDWHNGCRPMVDTCRYSTPSYQYLTPKHSTHGTGPRFKKSSLHNRTCTYVYQGISISHWEDDSWDTFK